jgi:hypothetical protein
MKKAILPILLAVAAAALSYVVTSWSVTDQAQRQARFDVGRLELQKTFLTNTATLRPITDLQQRPDLQKYLNEINVLTNWYFKNPAKEFWDQFPDRYDPESIIKDYRRLAEEEGPRQKSAKSNLPIREECYQLARAAYDELKSGTYKAVASDYQGSVRFDVWQVKMGDNRLQWRFITWGGIGDLVADGWHLRWYKTPSPQEVAEYEKELARAKRRREEPEMQDPRGLHFAEAASASKAPVLPVFEGSDYLSDFPAGASLNYFVTPACPPDAEELEIKFKLKARAMSGEDQAMEFAFRMPVDPGWKGSWDGVRSVEAADNYGAGN